MKRFSLAAVFLLVACERPPNLGTSQQAVTTSSPGATPKFTEFESGQVRPLALSDDGQYLYVCNTPDDTLEILFVGPLGRVTQVGHIRVGLEPVAVALHGSQAWVVNHLSDDVSIVDVSHPLLPSLVRTLHVGDEPRDIVFAGPGRNRAFVSTAHRGQNNSNDPQLQTPGVPRADVWVIDSTNPDASDAVLGGHPAIVSLFTDTPRGLAVSPDGSKVYAAGFHTGNQTTTVNELLVAAGAGPIPSPSTDAAGNPAPNQGLIVRKHGSQWLDSAGRDWSSVVNFNLPDKDVFAIDAMASPPTQMAAWSGVGTVLFNMSVNPVSGKIYVSNTDARNDVPFSGPGIRGGSTHRGHFSESRVTVISGSAVLPRHLNKHINYAVCCSDNPTEKAAALATPLQSIVSADGATLYVAAFGSGAVGVLPTAQLEDDTFVPSAANKISVTGGGPSGLALSGNRLYVMTRFDNAISVVNTNTRVEIQHLVLPNPEPLSVTKGRPFLYDAARTSSHGDSNCAGCHVFGDFDSLAWNAGNPDGVKSLDYNPVNPAFNPFYPPEIQEPAAFHPMKGPMTTQSLRGLANHGPMHWRGDKTGSGPGITNAQPDSGYADENAAFNAFNVAFVDFGGNSGLIAAADMQDFTDFALQLQYPPSPIRKLDDSLTPDQADGEVHFDLERTDDRCPITMPPAECDAHTELQFSCNTCHSESNGGSNQDSFRITFDPFRSQAIKNPHLRNLYQKVGMFGMPQLFVLTPFGFLPGTEGTPFTGDQVRGFGYIHDGSFDTVEQFVGNASFADFSTRNGIPFGPPGAETRRKVAAYLLAFDGDLKPIVGQQATLTSANAATIGPRLDLLLQRAAVGDCELVAKVRVLREKGYLFVNGQWVPDYAALPPITDSQLRQLAHAGAAVTYTCVPVGSGRRVGVDADLDGYLDGDEVLAGTDPRDPNSHP